MRNKVGSLVLGALLAAVCAGLVGSQCRQHAAKRESAVENLDQIRKGCGDGVELSCARLELLVWKPCVERRDGVACLWLGYLNERRMGTRWNHGVGYARSDVSAAAHFGIACGRQVPEACEILRAHYESPLSPCPFQDQLNPLGQPRCP